MTTGNIWDQIIRDTDPYQVNPSTLTAIVDTGRGMEALTLATIEAYTKMAELGEIFNRLALIEYDRGLSYVHVIMGVVLVLLTVIIAAN